MEDIAELCWSVLTSHNTMPSLNAIQHFEDLKLQNRKPVPAESPQQPDFSNQMRIEQAK